MAIIFGGKKRNGQRGHTRPRPLTISLDQPGWLYTSDLLGIFRVSHSTFDKGVKSGRFPPPDGRDGRRPIWKTETIKAFLDSPRVQKKPQRFRGDSAPETEAEREAELEMVNERIASLCARRDFLMRCDRPNAMQEAA